MLAACGDCWWDKHASGRHYDSISGCSVVIDYEAQLAMGIAPMSNMCNKYTRGIPHAKKICTKNVDCSLKGMEAIRSANIVQALF